MKPYIICYVVTSIDGRIDCAMTENLPGVEGYYELLDQLNFDACLMGRVTAELEFAEKGRFAPQNSVSLGKPATLNKTRGNKPFDVVVDTNGVLSWKDACEYQNDLIIITSERVSKEYIDYLTRKNISYIVTGKNGIDLARAAELLAQEFGVKRLGIVGGASVNTAFLDAGLLDEIILLVGAGIDGRASFPPVFNRASDNPDTFIPLSLEDAKIVKNGGVLLRYKTK